MPEVIEAGIADRDNWMSFVSSRPEACLYHDYRWKDVLEESFGHKPSYLMARDAGKTIGVLPLIFMDSRIMSPAFISLPFLNYGGMLARDGEAALSLLERAKGLVREKKASYLEMRNTVKVDASLATREHKVTMTLALLGDAGSQWNGLDPKVRNQIRKAERSGLRAVHGKGELLDSFYRIFSRNMRDLGTPVPGKAFFLNILKYFPEEAGIFVVDLGGKPIGAGFTLSHKGTIEIPWASSLREYNKLCTNEFMYWEIIKFAVSKKMKIFDFGRCTKDSGTYRFKRQWEPQVKQLYWQYWAQDEALLPQEAPHKGRFAFQVGLWKRLPLFLANRLGPIVSKNITTF